MSQTTMRLCLSLLSLLVVLSPASGARADTLTATMFQPLKEVSHDVEIRVGGGVATYVVRRSFANLGTRHEEAQLGIVLPDGAVVTGLRIRGQQRWHSGELMKVGAARSLYKELTGMGPHVPRDPALLQWVEHDRVHLHLFPVAPKSVSTVEYTLTVPTHYADGRYILYYPRATVGEAFTAPVLRVFAMRRGSELRFDMRPAGDGEPNVGLPTPKRAVANSLTDGLEKTGSHIVSAIEVLREGRLVSLRIKAEIRDVSQHDLRVILVTPQGHRHWLHDQTGGDDSDLRIDQDVRLKATAKATGRWSLVVSDLAGLSHGTLENWSLTFKTKKGTEFLSTSSETPQGSYRWPNNEKSSRSHTIEIEAPHVQTLHGRLGRVAEIAGKHFQRLELDIAKELAPLPKRLSVVFAIDLSKSLGESARDAQLEIARAYLSHVPRAKFQLVGYRRGAVALTTSFVNASEFDDVVKSLRETGALRLGNGSALHAGLSLASKLLASRKGTRRILLLSDGLLRPSWQNSEALAALAKTKTSVVTHLAKPSGAGAARLLRVDHEPLAAIAASTGGIMGLISGARKEQRRELAAAALQFVRPVQIDNVTVSGAYEMFIPTTLHEGAGVREMVAVERAPRQVVVRGRLWSMPFRKVIRASAGFSQRSAGFVFSHDLHASLSETEQTKLAMHARAVSPMTAYLAIEPGVRPSTAGIPSREVVGGVLGGVVGGVLGGALAGSTSLLPKGYWHNRFAAAKSQCVKQHAPKPGWRFAMEIDMTFAEIVDIGAPASGNAFETCLVESAWKFDLEDQHHPEERRRWKVELSD